MPDLNPAAPEGSLDRLITIAEAERQTKYNQYKLVRVRSELVIEAHKRGLIVSRVCNTALENSINQMDRSETPIYTKIYLEGTHPKTIYPETISKILKTE
jgi:hypothetical protein